MSAPDHLKALLPPASDMPQVSGWVPVDLGPYIRGEIVEQPPELLRRTDGVALLYPGKLNLFFGESESAKTWVANSVMAVEIKAGHHVIFIDYEDNAATAVARLIALGVTGDELMACLTYINPETSFDEIDKATVAEAIELRGPPTLVVIDSLTDAMNAIGKDPISGIDVSDYYNGSPRWLADTGAAVTMIDHVTKATEGRGRWAIGSERKISKLDGAAYSFEMIRPFGRSKTGLVKVKVSKDRPGFVRQHEDARKVIALVELESFPDGGVSVHVEAPEASSDGDGSFRPTFIMGQLAKAIEATPGLTKRALRAAVSGKNDLIDLALELLISEGYVEVRRGARGANEHYTIRPFPPVAGGSR